MTKNVVLVLLFCIFYSGFSNADVEGKIDWVESEVKNDRQALQITMKNNLNTCTHANAEWTNSAYLPPDAPNFQAIMSIALAAKMADRTVVLGAFYSSAEDNRCIISKLRIK